MSIRSNNPLEIETMHQVISLFEQESTRADADASRITEIALEGLSQIGFIEDKYYKIKGAGASIGKLLAHALGISEVDKAKRQFAKTLKSMKAKTITEVIPHFNEQLQSTYHAQGTSFLQKMHQAEREVFQKLLKNRQLPSVKELEKEGISLNLFLQKIISDDVLYSQLETSLLKNPLVKAQMQELLVQAIKENWGRFSDTLMPSILNNLSKRGQNAPPIKEIVQNSMKELEPFSTVMKCTSLQEALLSIFSHTATEETRKTVVEAIQKKFSISEFLQELATSKEALPKLEEKDNRLFLTELLFQKELKLQEMEEFLLNAHNNHPKLNSFFFTDLVKDLKKRGDTPNLQNLIALLNNLGLLNDDFS